MIFKDAFSLAFFLVKQKNNNKGKNTHAPVLRDNVSDKKIGSSYTVLNRNKHNVRIHGSINMSTHPSTTQKLYPQKNLFAPRYC